MSDNELLRRVVEHPRGWKTGVPRWSALTGIFCVGSTTASELCVRFGFNPGEIKKRRRAK